MQFTFLALDSTSVIPCAPGHRIKVVWQGGIASDTAQMGPSYSYVHISGVCYPCTSGHGVEAVWHGGNAADTAQVGLQPLRAAWRDHKGRAPHAHAEEPSD